MASPKFDDALPAAPPALLNAQGQPAPHGCYAGRVANLNTSLLDVAWTQRRFKRKAWLYVGCYTPSVLCGFAIADVGYAGTAFCYVYHIESKQFIEIKTTKPFAFPSEFQPGWQGVWQIHDGNKLWRISLDNNNKMQVKVESPKLNLHLVMDDDLAGLSAICDGRPFNFTYKNAAQQISGSIWAFDKEHKIDGPVAILDYSRGYPPRKTTWNWVSFAGQTDLGQPLGLNLVAHHNNGLENGMWLGGKLYGLSNAKFSYGKPIDKVPWRIKTDDGVVDMSFLPYGSRTENTNALIAKSIFSQPYGEFEGTIRIPGQDPQPFTGYGVVEEHFALW